MGFTAAGGFGELLERPLGRYACEGQIAFWCAERSLTGMIAWGRPTLVDIERLIRFFDEDDHRYISRDCDFILDLRGLELVDSDAFAVLAQALSERRAEMEDRLRRHALIRDGGLLGAAAAGFHGMLGSQVKAAVFGDVASALAWFGRANDPPLTQAIEDLYRSVTERGSLRARLRAWLETRLVDATIQEGALALGVSTRALQRELQAQGTSFRDELDAVRLALAETQLRDSDLKMDAVAQRVGFSSGAHFTNWFRRHRGIAPTAYRQRHR